VIFYINIVIIECYMILPIFLYNLMTLVLNVVETFLFITLIPILIKNVVITCDIY
jgi:hypothetical protein